MAYKAEFRNASERKLVNLAWEISGLSQGAFTRVVLLKEALAVMEKAKVLQMKTGEEPSHESAEASPDSPVPGEAGSEGASGDILADTAAADGASK